MSVRNSNIGDGFIGDGKYWLIIELIVKAGVVFYPYGFAFHHLNLFHVVSFLFKIFPTKNTKISWTTQIIGKIIFSLSLEDIIQNFALHILTNLEFNSTFDDCFN